MRTLLRGTGAVLLFLAGSGGGAAVYWHRRDTFRQLRTFTLLFLYLQRMVEYRTMTAQCILQAAAATQQFTGLHLERCHTFADLPLPVALGDPLREEFRTDLAQLATAPRRSVCTSLQRMYALCLKESEQAEEAMRRALRIYPRLGVCLGLLAAILFY